MRRARPAPCKLHKLRNRRSRRRFPCRTPLSRRKRPRGRRGNPVPRKRRCPAAPTGSPPPREETQPRRGAWGFRTDAAGSAQTEMSAAPPPWGQGNRPEPQVQANGVFPGNGAQFAAPPAQELPDWLRIAQQNKEPNFNARPPRVEPAPRQTPEPSQAGSAVRNGWPRPENPPQSRAQAYVAAGYPPELIERQRSEEETAFARGYGRNRHGAQYAAPRTPAYGSPDFSRSLPQQTSFPPRQEPFPRGQAPGMDVLSGSPSVAAPQGRFMQEPSPRNPYFDANAQAESPYTVTLESAGEPNRLGAQANEPSGEQADETRKRSIPYLGIAVILMAALAVTLWILQLSFAGQTESVLAARNAAQAKLIDTHPFEYRELIEPQAAANNLHPAFVAAIVLNESSFNPHAESDVGARGLMQMMPDTAEWVHGKIGDGLGIRFRPDVRSGNQRALRLLVSGVSERPFPRRPDPGMRRRSTRGRRPCKTGLTIPVTARTAQTIEPSQTWRTAPPKNYALTACMNTFAIYRRSIL